ncbi:ABC transporter substrate-binding protein [Microbacterium sp. X-17]|uniref:ABC transporter substrate-binding protein n=1 Tax=Microbacterium sp. X-17 TaxID=3144404 RepID=UPI0031F4F457
MKFPRAAAVSIIAAVALLVSGCAGAGASQSGTSESLTLGAVVQPASLDAANASWGDRAPFYQAVYDTLLLAQPDGTLAPFLATSWEYNDDNTKLTLHLRDGVTFSDGTPLNAAAVKTSLERFKAGSGPDASYLTSLDSVTAVDDSTVVLNLSQPDPAMLNYLSRSAGLVGSPALATSADANTDPIGSGPYILDTGRTVIGSSYVYTRNPNYWNPALQHYNELTIRVLQDPTAGLNAIRSNEIDALRLLSNDSLGEIQNVGWKVYPLETEVTGLLLFDRAGALNPALADVRVRQAINYALDRQGLLRALQSGLGTVTEQMFPPTSSAFDPALDQTYPYDPARARELLAEAGYPNGLTIQMPSMPVFAPATYSLISQQLADVGITVNDLSVTPEQWVPNMIAQAYPASFMVLEQNSNWQLIQFMIAPTAMFNPFHYQDATSSALIQQVRVGDEQAGAKAAADLNAHLVKDAWFAPMYRAQNSFVAAPSVNVVRVPSNVYPNIYDFTPAS